MIAKTQERKLDFWSDILSASRIAIGALIIHIVIVLVLSLFFAISFIGHNERASLPDMVYGTAHKPFVYRALLPVLVRIGAPLVPLRWVENAQTQPLLAEMLAALEAGHFPREAFLTWLLLYSCLVGYWLAFKGLIQAFVSGRAGHWIGSVFPWLVVLLTAPIFFPSGYLYDLPQLFLFTLALVLMSRPEWLHYYLFVFAIANVNKETSLLLIPVFATYYWRRMERQEFKELLLYQLGIGIGVRLVLMWIFLPNPGAVMENHLLLHWQTLTTSGAQALVMAVLAVLVAVGVGLHWRRKPAFLKTAFLVLAPLFIGLYFIGGYPGELRVFLEILPLTALLMVTGYSWPIRRAVTICD